MQAADPGSGCLCLGSQSVVQAPLPQGQLPQPPVAPACCPWEWADPIDLPIDLMLVFACPCLQVSFQVVLNCLSPLFVCLVFMLIGFWEETWERSSYCTTILIPKNNF